MAVWKENTAIVTTVGVSMDMVCRDITSQDTVDTREGRGDHGADISRQRTRHRWTLLILDFGDETDKTEVGETCGEVSKHNDAFKNCKTTKLATAQTSLTEDIKMDKAKSYKTQTNHLRGQKKQKDRKPVSIIYLFINLTFKLLDFIFIVNKHEF